MTRCAFPETSGVQRALLRLSTPTSERPQDKEGKRNESEYEVRAKGDTGYLQICNKNRASASQRESEWKHRDSRIPVKRGEKEW